MASKYHTRDHYEIVLLELNKLACVKNVADIRSYSDTELLVNINNLLSYFNVETFSLDAIEEICEYLKQQENEKIYL